MRFRLNGNVFSACLLSLTVLAAPSLAAGVRGKPPVPDLTRGGKPDQAHDWTLGPTGARGWIWGWRGHTFDARQILVTLVAKGSPADGVLQKGDVILGASGRRFDSDARIQFARAVTEAEKQSGRGVLRLIRRRGGQVNTVQVKLPVLGDYSDTAPYDCPKSRRIFELGCRAIARKGLKNVSIPNDLNALALLASGEKAYLPLLAEYARKVAAFQTAGMASWHYGYANMFLAEYYMATRDVSVLPGLRRITLEIARGQSNAGTWGHGFARPNGVLGGYGAMNQPGLTLTISMVLAREAGVRDDALDRAIARASRFLRWYAGKGAIPYGDHEPWPDHEDNGKCGSAAVLFDLLADAEAAGFFAKMGTAAHAERESGHTGNFFNVLWALPGVSRCGPLATAAYFSETAWYYDLARSWDGTFVYQGTPANWNGHSYNGWDSTGAYLLAYALPLKSLTLTGRKPSVVHALTQSQVAQVIDAGRGFDFWTDKTCYDNRSAHDLLACLSSWSPAVRIRAARALAKKPGDSVPQLLRLLEGDNPQARDGACRTLGALKGRAAPAVPALIKTLSHEDLWLRIQACVALADIGEPAKEAVPILLRLATRQSHDDPRQHMQRYVAFSLFSTRRPGGGRGLIHYWQGRDLRLLYPAVRKLLQNPDGRARGEVGSLYDTLTYEEIQPLLPAVYAAIMEPAPSGVMFASGIRMKGLELLAKHRIAEGIHACVTLARSQNPWASEKRTPAILKILRSYGAAAKVAIPDLETLGPFYEKQPGFPANLSKQKAAAVRETIHAIKASKDHPQLRSLGLTANR